MQEDINCLIPSPQKADVFHWPWVGNGWEWSRENEVGPGCVHSLPHSWSHSAFIKCLLYARQRYALRSSQHWDGHLLFLQPSLSRSFTYSKNYLLLLSAYRVQETHLHFWTIWMAHVTSFKLIRDFNPPDHCDLLEMGTWYMPGQSGSRRLMSQIFPLASGKRSLFLFLAGVLRLFKLDSSWGATYKSQRAQETWE